ncbi:MAG TPA: DHA2 family efflux MFS transporter permease subunit [Actinophytocola sp.]|uniref:DHA2 family efflux MFS transporter permease subunit n=1 Tax=Actinophytocola sp. TaxID=1872138 RepID=UPI002DB7197E|nr:DHA2 family efflux MFS transporter permease subunit [Actinophytocola sp.]HEU5472418.1 DHA2 family efflux MFS transporter permease subunit [Actinophytocola sp.]
MPGAPSGTGLDRKLLAVGAVVVLGAIMSILDVTVVNVAISKLSVEFETSLETIQWIATGYTLALATVIPLTGWAADRFGTKRLYLTAITLFLIGSALAGTAWSVESLIGFRVLQGLGGGMIMPAGMIILTQAAGPQRIGRVMSVLGVPMLLGPIFGPILGGWLVDDVSWRWIFFINVPVGIIALLLGLRILPTDQPKPTKKLDLLGVLLLSPGLAALIYGLAQVPKAGGFTGAEVLVPAIAGAALIIAFVVRANRTANPLIDLKLFRNKTFSVSSTAMVLFAVAFFGAMLMLPLYYQTVRAETALSAGLLLAPQGIGAMLTMPIAGIVADRFGPARIAQAGIVVIVAGMAVFTQLGADTSYWLLGSALFVMGMGMGMTMMPMMSAALRTITKSEVGGASTSLNIIQQIGGSIGTAIMAVILSSELAERLPGGGDRGGLGAAQSVPPELREQVNPLIADAFGSTFFWSLALLAVAFVPALFLPRGKAPVDPESTADERVALPVG